MYRFLLPPASDRKISSFYKWKLYPLIVCRGNFIFAIKLSKQIHRINQ